MVASDASGSPGERHPAIFEVPLFVEAEDIDGLGHVNNVVYLRWIQDAATAHWNHASTLEQRETIAWVAVRHEIDYVKPAFQGEKLVARTYVGAVTGARFERFVEIYRVDDSGNTVHLLAKSRSVWASIDMATKRLKRVDPALNLQFFE